MKNSGRISLLGFGLFVLTIFVFSPSGLYAQNKDQAQTLAQFPDNVSGIFKNSCVGCHNDNGRGKAKELLNLSDWDKMSHKNQVKTGKLINKVIAKGTMPPPDMVSRRPELGLNADQKKEVASWTKGLKKK